MRYAKLAAVAACGLLFACQPPQESASQETPAADPTAPAEGETAAEVAAAPPLPTHWTSDGDIGNGLGPVGDDDLLAGAADTEKWLLYGGNYANYRHSPIDDINAENVAGLQVAWAFPTGTMQQFEVSPTVYDGIMYVSSSNNRLFALNAATGELYWRYDHPLPDDLRLCCGIVNRGVAITGDTIIMATLDADLVAFNRLTGEVLWETTMADYAAGFSATSMPMIVRDMAIIGIAGGEYGVRGFFDAYDVATGELRWRHYTVPDDGEEGVETWAGDSYKTGGAPAWTSGAYDPETDILYWTTGNPAPDWNGDLRKGDNLYSNSLLAVDPNTGERKWHFQFTPHDVWDYDGNTQLFLVDVERNGETISAIVQANRNGFFYILDRATGAFIDGTVYVEELNWATLDENGRPVVNEQANPVEDPDFRVCPSNLGGMNGAWTGAFKSGPRSGLHPHGGVLPVLRERHLDLPEGPGVHGRHAHSRRRGERHGARPRFRHRREHGRGEVALHGPRSDDGRRPVAGGRRRLHRQPGGLRAGLGRGLGRGALEVPHGRRHAQPAGGVPGRRQELRGHRLRQLHHVRGVRRRPGGHPGRRPPVRLRVAGFLNAVVRLAAAALMLAAANAYTEAAPSSALSICLPSDDAPRSDRARGTGLDLDVARLLGRALERPLQLVWLPELGEIDEVSDFNFRPLLAGTCDAHLSVPGVEALGRQRGALALSTPYYGAAYEVIPAEANWQWGAPAPGTIAVLANSVAHIAVDAAGLPWSMRPTAAEIVQVVATGEVAMGVVWGPDLGALDVERAEAFAPPPVLRWNQHAATRRGDPLVEELDRIFQTPDFEARMAGILERHGVPVRRTFESVYSPEGAACRRTPVGWQPSSRRSFWPVADPPRRQRTTTAQTPKPCNAARRCSPAPAPATATAPAVERAAPYLFDCTWVHGSGGEQDIFDVIADGVPNTAMLGFRGKLPEGDADIWRLVAYIKDIGPAC